MKHQKTLARAALTCALMMGAWTAPSSSQEVATASTYIVKGHLAVRKAQYADAIAHYTKASELEPLSAKAWAARGEVYRNQGQFEKAIADYKKALQIDSAADLQPAQSLGVAFTPETPLPFLMAIEDLFNITGRGVTVTGRVTRGQIKIGDTVEIVGLKAAQTATVVHIEVNRKSVSQVESGETCGILLRGVQLKDIERGQTLIAPGSIIPSTEFEAQLYVFNKEQGGRSTPFNKSYRPQFFFRVGGVTGNVTEVQTSNGTATPGEIVSIQASLLSPEAIEPGLRFSIREGGRTVGIGIITKVKASATP